MGSTSFCKSIKLSLDLEPTDSLYTQQVKKTLAAILGLMSEMERRVLQMRLGLVDGRELTVEEVATELGESPHQIQQWEESAMRIMHHPELACKPKEFPGNQK